LYFAHSQFLPEHGQGHSFCKLYYNDLGNEAGVFPKEKIPGNALRLYRSALFEPVMAGPSRGMAPHWFFAPAGPRAKVAWRKLGIELGHEALVISWDGQRVCSLPQADVLKCTLPPDERWDVASLPFHSRGGLGLYLHLSTASYRNVRLDPLFGK